MHGIIPLISLYCTGPLWHFTRRILWLLLVFGFQSSPNFENDWICGQVSYLPNDVWRAVGINNHSKIKPLVYFGVSVESINECTCSVYLILSTEYKNGGGTEFDFFFVFFCDYSDVWTYFDDFCFFSLKRATPRICCLFLAGETALQLSGCLDQCDDLKYNLPT